MADEHDDSTVQTVFERPWQFWLDPTMAIAVILPPGGAAFAHFPCGEDAIGQPLFNVLDLRANLQSAEIFMRRFDLQKNIRNARFVHQQAPGGRSTLLISGTPLWSDEGGFEGYRCTVVADAA